MLGPSSADFLFSIRTSEEDIIDLFKRIILGEEFFLIRKIPWSAAPSVMMMISSVDDSRLQDCLSFSKNGKPSRNEAENCVQ
jgi:hypothetical protein